MISSGTSLKVANKFILFKKNKETGEKSTLIRTKKAIIWRIWIAYVTFFIDKEINMFNPSSTTIMVFSPVLMPPTISEKAVCHVEFESIYLGILA